MTREEACNVLNRLKPNDVSVVNDSAYCIGEALTMAIKALEQETKTLQFAKWVATEIFDDMWEYNKDAFAEIACRKLAMLGIVRANGDEWELVEPQENNNVNCKTTKCENCTNHNCCDYESQESEDK